QEALEHTQADGISGLVLLPGQSPSDKPFFADTALGDPGGPNYQRFNGIIDTHGICTARFAVRRGALLGIGGFDESMDGTFDDVELGLRLVGSGFKIIHHNQPRVLHLSARLSGSRSPKLPDRWRFSNLFYFQMRHYWRSKPKALLLLSLWE